MSRRTASYVVIGALLASGLTAFAIHAKRQGELTKNISRIHIIQHQLQEFVNEHKEFPESLPSWTQAAQLDAETFRFPAGTSLTYTRPSMDAPEDTTILVLTSPNGKIVVSKSFTRSLNP